MDALLDDGSGITACVGAVVVRFAYKITGEEVYLPKVGCNEACSCKSGK